MIGKPLPYTTNPVALLLTDIWLFFHLSFDIKSLSLLSIVWPLIPNNPNFDELAPTPKNAWALAVHIVLVFSQLAYLGFALLAPFCGTPTIMYLGVLIAGVMINKFVCDASLNGPHGQTLYAGEQFSEYMRLPRKRVDQTDKLKLLESRDPKHSGERWVFINGVAAGSHWTQANLNRIARTFQRPVLGIHNATYGIVFDVLECVIQRTFGYPTLDIRTAYAKVSELLGQADVDKLVFIAHSQGSIEAGMVLDWLFATVPQKDIQKLEVYTFGNAANHWNCPELENGQRVIEHVEHYANDKDWVARFGALYFRGVGQQQSHIHPFSYVQPTRNGQSKAKNAVNGSNMSSTTENPPDVLTNRFVGKLFLRKASGHQFNQHYMANMFTMDKQDRLVLDGNEFMNEVVDHYNFQDCQCTSTRMVNGDDIATKAQLVEPVKQIKDESRLWQYRNGGVPSA
ncbi:uncharacterized protein HMPREF1541_01147 [Cyphellophora europaea CBS 101466]|uniref:DUF676 domain-containing protein n=1 Tax=Cyphellophora europaea (strain CBS 101466) TaxID=1220924 RepID=W2SE47_CYPE1|nr:uncharacterized protein HMPREF1541_01147 [Cyphellophora europaea CBS 101466]ETN46957.1 hypothetical protein HMPREF1541_01147 [Cyphellophora europaea CBS 101466]